MKLLRTLGDYLLGNDIKRSFKKETDFIREYTENPENFLTAYENVKNHTLKGMACN